MQSSIRSRVQAEGFENLPITRTFNKKDKGAERSEHAEEKNQRRTQPGTIM